MRHLFPPFDSWWGNIFASLIWSPFAAGFLMLLHWLSRRRQNKHTKQTHKNQARIEQLLVNLHEHHGIPVPEAKE